MPSPAGPHGPWNHICLKCGNRMMPEEHPLGTTYRCEIERCGHVVNIPYGKFVPAIQEEEVDWPGDRESACCEAGTTG